MTKDGESDEELAHIDLRYIKDNYGYPHMVGHRASLAGALFESCKQEKAIKFNFSSSIEEVLSFAPRSSFRVKPREGDAYVVESNVLLAADGIKSVVRAQMLKELGINADVEDTGQAAYRIMLKREDMRNDPELLKLIDSEMAVRWIGEKRHIIAYPVSNHGIYNISTIQPDKNFAAAPEATYTTKGSKSTMLDVFSDFCPMIQRMLNLVPDGEVCEWKLRTHSELSTWVHGSVALVGDACHPTQPHLAQGAAQAIEDAAVLGIALSRCPSAESQSINRSLRVYEMLRKDRTTLLVGMAAASGKALHLGEGAAKEERDKQFAKLRSEKKGEVPDKWADADVQKMIYGHDCMEIAKDKFQYLYDELVKVP